MAHWLVERLAFLPSCPLLDRTNPAVFLLRVVSLLLCFSLFFRLEPKHRLCPFPLISNCLFYLFSIASVTLPGKCPFFSFYSDWQSERMFMYDFCLFFSAVYLPVFPSMMGTWRHRVKCNTLCRPPKKQKTNRHDSNTKLLLFDLQYFPGVSLHYPDCFVVRWG